MNQRRKKLISMKLFIGLLFVVLLTYVGCGNNNESTVISSVVNTETPAIEKDEFVIDSDDSYYTALEKKLNEELDINRAPDKCAAQGLTKIVLNFTTDEIQTCSTYDLSKVIVTAYFSDKTAEVIIPVWSIYSGGGTLDGTVYTATNKPAIIVFKSLYTENGIYKLALFRLTVTGLTSILLNKTTDEIQLPATYDLSTELIVTAKLSNGTTKAIVKGDPNLKWTLASGAGTLTDGVYTPSAKIETAVFKASYNENGVTKTVQFKLKVTGLSSLILSKTTDEVNSCETYDLASKIIVSNKLSNGTINEITVNPDLTWALSSGAGIFANKIYTAPAKAETAVFTASYTEAGITKTAQFRLKVTGLSSVVLDKTTDEIMLPATYDLASEVHATAKFSDGESKSVDLIWALSSGSGVLSGSMYTPAPKPETAVFIGSYTENGITKTAQFRLKVVGLSSLTLSKTTDEVASCATYDLSQIAVSDKLSNGTINNITNSTTWKLVSGFGTLSGTTYTAPARAETTVFTASYTEAGITKAAQFRLKVIALASISLSQTTDEAQILVPYDLAANIYVTAKLSNGQMKPVSGNDPNLKWTLSYGSGVLSGALYTPSEKIETAVLTATFTENGVAQSAQLRLKSTATLRGKVELVGLTLAKTTDSVRIGQTYDLSRLIAIAKFADKTTAEVSLSWIVSSGGGFIAGTTYTAPSNVATVKLMGTYKALDGSTKSAYFTLTIYGNEIYGNRGMITLEGAKFHLTNGVTVEIPENSVSEPFDINFENNRSFSQFEQLPGQTVFSCNFTKNVNEVILKIPVDSGVTTEDVSLACFMQDLDKAVILTPAIKNSEAIFFIGDNSKQTTAPLRAPSTGDRRVYGFSTFIIYVNDNKAKQPFIDTVNKVPEEKDLKWPVYMQVEKTCYAATWLMLMKGYKEIRPTKELNPQFDSIFDIVDALMKNGVTIHDDAKNYGGNEAYEWSTSTESRYDGTDQFFINHIQTSFNVYAGNEKVSSLTSYYNQMTVKSYFCSNFDALTNLVPTLLSRKIPIKVDSAWHSMLILGYEANNVVQNGSCDYSKIKFWVSNPGSLNRKECLTFDKFMK